MKSAKAPAADGPSNRRSQPVRQTRTNPSRVTNPRGSAGGRDSLAAGGPTPDQPIDIFPAITHFADAITAMPKELVRHFTLLKEVDAKIYAPEDALFRLVDASMQAPPPATMPANPDAPASSAPASAPMSAQNSSAGIRNGAPTVPPPTTSNELSSTPISGPPPPGAGSGDDTRRQLYHQTAFKIQEMLTSLEEKNHVISTANDALQKQLARIDQVWPHVESEFSDEAKWGSIAHWAYPENRGGNKNAQAERSRREGAAAISAAAQQLAEEAAARSDTRKQAVQAKKNLKTQQHHQGSDFDDPEGGGRGKAESGKKGGGKVRKTADSTAANVGLGISTNGAVNGSTPQSKRRKVEKPPTAHAPAERAMASVYGNDAPKTKTSSPKGTPAPEGPKKRKALPSSSNQAKKRNGTTKSPSVTSSPVIGAFPDAKVPRGSPAPSAAKPPTASRARNNSIQSSADNSKARPPSSASNNNNNNKPNGIGAALGTPALAAPTGGLRASEDQKATKGTPATTGAKSQPKRKDADPAEVGTIVNATATKKEQQQTTKQEDADRKSEQPAEQTSTTNTTVTKSGRASKPSTPALATFQEAQAQQQQQRARTSRNTDNGGGGGNKRSKKGSAAPASGVAAAAAAAAPPVAAVAKLSASVEESVNNSSSMHIDNEDGDIDADEPLYCYCNSVSYGEMVACDADNCEREWFHLECVGLKVAPKGNAKWYCEPCKKRLTANGKKVNGR